MRRRVRGWKPHAACITQLTIASLHGECAPSQHMTHICMLSAAPAQDVPPDLLLVMQAPLRGFDATVRCFA